MNRGIGSTGVSGRLRGLGEPRVVALISRVAAAGMRDSRQSRRTPTPNNIYIYIYIYTYCSEIHASYVQAINLNLNMN